MPDESEERDEELREPPSREVWEEYGRRKRLIESIGLLPDEYNRAINRIRDELGL